MSTPRQPMESTQIPIAVVGMSCLFPKAPNLKQYWRLIRWSEDAVSDVPASHWPVEAYFDCDPKATDMTYCRRGAFLSAVDFDPTEFGIPPAALEATDTAQLLGLVAAKEALDDAGYGGNREFDRTRASVILGVTGALELVIPLGARLGHPIWRRALLEAGVEAEVASEVVKRISDAYVPWQENSFPGLLGNVVAGRIANRLDLRGTNCVVDAACASSLAAIHLAVLELSHGRSDMALTGGVDTFNDIFMFMCFSKTQALSPTGDARPFSKDADGTVIGEGTGIVVLKRLADAERDGDRIYGVIRAVGRSSDGRSQSIYAPRVAGQIRALEDAYSQAQVDPSEIELVEAHGTGTRVGDSVEIDALRSVYGAAEGRRWCALGSVKSQIGHTKAAAGVASLIKVILALYHKTIPATLKVRSPLPQLEVSDCPFYLGTESRPWFAAAGRLRRAAVSSFGFGGSNFHAVLEEHPAEIERPAWDGSVEIVALSAPAEDQLSNLLAAWQRFVGGGPDAEDLAARAASSRKTFSTKHAYRLVLVVEHGSDPAALLAAAAALASGATGQPRRVANAHFGGPAPPGRLAFLFPGQASQYVGMCRDLVCMFPEARASVVEANCGFEGSKRLSDYVYPPPVFDETLRAVRRAELTETRIAQPALGAVSLAVLRVLRRFGAVPDVVGGHSYGELVALCAAGRISDDRLRQLSMLRGRLMADSAAAGTMVAVEAPLEALDRLVAELGADVVVANRNGPGQGVLSGPHRDVERAAAACRARRWRVVSLPVSGAFHSRLMGGAARAFAEALEGVDFGSGRVEVVANSTATRYPDHSDGVRRLLSEQLVQPVRFVEQIENLYDAGVRTFVEIGPKSVLSGLVRTILGKKPHDALPVDASAGKRSGVTDLANVLARLAAAGYPVELSKWEEEAPPRRKPKMAVPILGANFRAKRPATAALVVEQPSGNGRTKLNAKSTDESRSEHLQGIFQVVQEGLRAMQSLQQQTAAAHQRFLETQEQAHKTFQVVMESQQRLFERLAGVPAPPPAAENVAAPGDAAAGRLRPGAAEWEGTGPSPTTAAPGSRMSHFDGDRVRPAGAAEERSLSASSLSDQAPGGMRKVAAAPAIDTGGEIETRPCAEAATDSFESTLLGVVCALTGYPSEMLALDMDMEADLGIDSIKRVEILAALQETMPGLKSVDSSYMGSLRTLRNIVEYMSGGVQDSAPAAEGADMTPHPPTTAPAREEKSAKAAERETGPELDRRVLVVEELAPAVERQICIAPGYEIWVVDDGTGLAGALVDRFVSQGIAARVVGTAVPVDGEACAPVGGLIHLLPPGAENGSSGPEETQDLLKGAFSLTKELGLDIRRAATQGGALFATVSRMDGAFGLRGGDFDPIHGGLAGLTKTVAQEWPGVACRALDVDHQWADVGRLADRLILELGADGPIEVGVSEGARRRLRMESRPVAGGPCLLSEGDVVVVSGGARGVTAEAAVALAEAWRPTLVLLGRSPEPEAEPSWSTGLAGEAEIKKAILAHVFGSHRKPSPSELEAAYRRHVANSEISANLARISKAGARVIYRSVNVRDEAAVRTTIEEIRRTEGPIRGIVHGAGVIEDRLIDDKDLSLFESVFDTKVAGLFALIAAARTDEVRFLVLFSSVSGRLGRKGQVDYAMANEVLNKVAQRQAVLRPDCRVVSINWGPWDGGMVHGPLKRELARLGMDLIPPAAGARAMLAELGNRDRGAVEVIIGGRIAEPGIEDRASGATDKRPVEDGLATVLERTIEVQSHPFMRSHVIAGHPVLPVAVMIEWLSHGAMHDNPGLVLWGLNDLRVLKGVILDGGPRELTVAASRAVRRDGAYEVALELRSRSAGGRNVLHARANAVLATTRPAVPSFEMEAKAHDLPYPRSVEATYRDVLFHGSDFHAIERIEGYSERGMTARLRSAPAPSQWMSEPLRSSWITDPLIIDGGLQLGLLWCVEQLGAPSLPSFGARYRQYSAALPKDGVTCVLQVSSSSAHRMTADVIFCDGADRVVASMRGYEWTVEPSLAAAFGRPAAGGAIPPGM